MLEQGATSVGRQGDLTKHMYNPCTPYNITTTLDTVNLLAESIGRLSFAEELLHQRGRSENTGPRRDP